MSDATTSAEQARARTAIEALDDGRYVNLDVPADADVDVWRTTAESMGLLVLAIDRDSRLAGGPTHSIRLRRASAD